MSLLKNWKIILAALTFAFFTGCAGSNGGSDEDYEGEETEMSEDGTPVKKKKAAPKEEIDENKLKKTEQEATQFNEENHKLRREIFDAKNKLGMPIDRPAEE
ncbi:MAG: hypothetical protein HUK21_08185 [Fibrobacteraceae bacterium]|nr:hypothetical protein [Fibrobacteraceae bacterium]